MSTRGLASTAGAAPARAGRETPRQRHDRLLLEIAAFMAEIDDTLSECTVAECTVAECTVAGCTVGTRDLPLAP